MKKLLAAILVCALTISCFSMFGIFAEEAAEDPTTFRAYAYEDGAGYSASCWLNSFDPDGECLGTDYVVFKAAAPIKGFGFPEIFAGREENDQDATVRFELFKWNESVEKTLEGTPVFQSELHLVGDTKNVEVKLDEKQPAGQYLFKVSQVTGMGDWDSLPAHYSVLPVSELKYSDNYMLFGEKGKFGFFMDFETTDGVKDYFLVLDGQSADMKIKPEKVIIAREGDTPHEIVEYGILTPEIPDGQVLYSIALSDSPTWNNANGDSDATFIVYKWKGDYDATVEGKPVTVVELTNHADNSNLTARFDTALRYGYRYLIVVEQSNSGKIGYWQGVENRPDGWEFFELGSEVEYNPALKAAYAEVGDLGPEPTEEPTKEPTATPEVTEAPTKAPTEEPVVTDAPKPTDKAEDNTAAPATEDSGTKEKTGGNNALPIIITAICAAVVIASVVVIILVSKKKK